MRFPNCECVTLGILLIDCYLINSHPMIYKKESLNLINELEKYYANPDINLPFSVFVYVIKYYLSTLNYIQSQSLIENYITYSSFPFIQNSEQNSITKKSVF